MEPQICTESNFIDNPSHKVIKRDRTLNLYRKLLYRQPFSQSDKKEMEPPFCTENNCIDITSHKGI